MVDKSYEENRQRVLETRRDITKNISGACRFIGYGLLAIFYTIKTGDSIYSTYIRDTLSPILWLIGASGAATVLLDYFQYFFGWQSVESARLDVEKLYDKSKLSYKAWNKLFVWKQYTAAIGAIAIFLLIIISDYGA